MEGRLDRCLQPQPASWLAPRSSWVCRPVPRKGRRGVMMTVGNPELLDEWLESVGMAPRYSRKDTYRLFSSLKSRSMKRGTSMRSATPSTKMAALANSRSVCWTPVRSANWRVFLSSPKTCPRLTTSVVGIGLVALFAMRQTYRRRSKSSACARWLEWVLMSSWLLRRKRRLRRADELVRLVRKMRCTWTWKGAPQALQSSRKVDGRGSPFPVSAGPP